MPSRRTQQPEGGAVCVNAHVRILCGGPGETRVPTAMDPRSMSRDPAAGRERSSVYKKHFAVVRQRPFVVRNDAFQSIGCLTNFQHSWYDIILFVLCIILHIVNMHI